MILYVVVHSITSQSQNQLTNKPVLRFGRINQRAQQQNAFHIHGTGSVLIQVLVLILILVFALVPVDAQVACDANSSRAAEYCGEKLFPGSQCVNGWCANPFQQGCLYTLVNHHHNTTSEQKEHNMTLQIKDYRQTQNPRVESPLE